MKSWSVFIIAMGCLIVALSPQMRPQMVYIIIGLAVVLYGVIRLKKNNKK